MTGRLVALGNVVTTDSNGTDTGQNARLSFWNESGADVTGLRVVFSNWKVATSTSPGEIDNANANTVSAGLEHPAGVFRQVLFGGAPSVVIQPGENVVSDIVAPLSAVASGAQFWVRPRVTVSSGQRWQRGYVIRTGDGEAADIGTATADLTMSGTITNSGQAAYGPVGILAATYTGTLRKVALAAIGDSITAGQVDGSSVRGNNGWIGRSAENRCPFIQLAVSGARAAQQVGNLARRIDLMGKLGITDLILGYGTNDIGVPRTDAQIRADLVTIATAVSAAGIRVHLVTIPPNTESTDLWDTLGGQTPNAGFEPGAGSVRGSNNAWRRTVPAPFTSVLDLSDLVESTRDSGLWGIQPTWTLPRTTPDGVHLRIDNIGARRGSHFLAADNMLIPAINAWLA